MQTSIFKVNNSRALNLSIPQKSCHIPNSNIKPTYISRKHDKKRLDRLEAGVAEYISQAFVKIFSVADDEPVNWAAICKPFDGKINHRERAQLKHMEEIVKVAKGCMDPKALNYDPTANKSDDSCVYEENRDKMTVDKYFKEAMEGVFDGNTKALDSDPPQWGVTPFTGSIRTKRDIEKMLAFEKVITENLEAKSEE